MTTKPAERVVEHETTIEADADLVYGLLARAEDWPHVFPPSVYVEREPEGGGDERIHIWATANGEVKNWTSRRRVDPAARRIEFRQEVSSPPVAAMGGTWTVEPGPGGTCRVVLGHDYRAVDDDPHDLLWIDRAVDRNSRSELASLKRHAELAAADLVFSFTDAVQIAGAAADAFAFVNEAALWPERLPHVARAELTETTPGLQTLKMDTRAKDGSTHTTESVRVCFPHHKIVYKQTTVPALMTAHTGTWLFRDDGSGSTASSEHTVVLNPDMVEKILGAGATVADARAYVQGALSANSLATLGHARTFAESR
ncbi:aromatase/cyclase [Actinomadura rayongensis]|uniref:Cyclase n=1 Tax=Actinomadura rayongensis TaxID=1429076 RepID=A0A6I4WKJ2_9ACTN|nr:aromatase/cyclase [Actinomadura rayongensis]MXQ68226.1 cyclase [Actinomadura rayongensis]